MIFSHTGLQERIQQMRWYSLVLGLLLSASYLFLEFQTIYPILSPLSGKWNDLLFALSCWSWLLAVCGFGMKHLSFSTPFLKYANEAALPFYILHQTVLLSLAYFVVQWGVPDIFKWMIILILTFAISVGLYEFLIRRLNLLRLLFGMKLAR